MESSPQDREGFVSWFLESPNPFELYPVAQTGLAFSFEKGTVNQGAGAGLLVQGAGAGLLVQGAGAGLLSSPLPSSARAAQAL